MRWVKAFARNCTEMVLEKILAACLRLGRGHKLKNWWILQSSYILCYCRVIAQEEQNLGEVFLMDPHNLLSFGIWMRKAGGKVQCSPSFYWACHWNTACIICIGSFTLGFWCPREQKALNTAQGLEVQHHDFFTAGPNIEQYHSSTLIINTKCPAHCLDLERYSDAKIVLALSKQSKPKHTFCMTVKHSLLSHGNISDWFKLIITSKIIMPV